MYQMFLDGTRQTILRLSDGASIPADPANTDYQQYLKFLGEGAQPLPADAALDGSSEE